MPHVTFVHGIANKVAAESLEAAWVDALRDDQGPDLRSEGVTTSLCYWADVLYASPLSARAASMEAGEESEVMAAEDVDMRWLEALPPDERAQVEELAAETDAASVLLDAPEVPDAEPEEDLVVGGGFERIPLPGPLKRRLMQAFLRDVHHYLWDSQFSPRPGQTYQVRTEVRRRAVEAITSVPESSRPHVVIGHSLGSVVVYDVLKNVAGTKAIDGLITVGSPLGLDEVQDRLVPGWSRRDGFPGERLTGSWLNVYDRLDPVCGFDPVLANDFRRSMNPAVIDVHEPNWGTWRHSIGKYLRGPQLRKGLVEALGL